MGLLLLLTSALLYSYVGPRSVDAQNLFAIRSITLSLEPREDVVRDTNVTVRCHAIVSTQQPLSRKYTIFKDSIKVYTKIINSSEDLLYALPNARVSNTGKYKCQISIEGKERESEAKKLTVTGVSTPVLHLHRNRLTEGEDLTASCTAPGETGLFIFYFYEDLKEKHEQRVNTNHVEATLSRNKPGQHAIQCSYTVQLFPDSIPSKKSSSISVFVSELLISPDLKIFPQSKVYEGDELTLSCAAKGAQKNNKVYVYLSQGTRLLKSGQSEVNYTMEAPPLDPAEFECRLEIDNVIKPVTKVVSVTELFSVPTLTMSPVEVFQNEPMTLICKSEKFASERLQKDELTYAIDPPQTFPDPRNDGEFVVKALPKEFNYTCVARARGIEKRSQTLTVRPKVSVSTPKISVVGRAVLGKPFKVLCQSDYGSLPINYTLMENTDHLFSFVAKTPTDKALFSVTVHHPRDINKFMCKATNSQREPVFSKRLDTIIIEPLSQPVLMVIPALDEITEGVKLLFICSISGTPPVTFKIYRVGNDQPLFITTSYENNTSYEIEDLGKDQGGGYYFEAFNNANIIVTSETVTIEVRLAFWKKVVIGGFCLLALSVLVVVCVLFFKSKRGERQAGAELSVKPSSPKSDDSLTVTLTHDTEVYNAATDAVPLPGYEGIEGRVTNGT